MGRRSRKRLADSDPGARAERARSARERSDRERSAGAPARAPVATATSPRRRPRLSEAPAAPWSPFPLVELCILAGIVLAVAGLLTHGSRGRLLLGFGLTLVTIASLELSIREHFAGYRSHTTLLAGACAVALDAALFFLTKLPPQVLLALGAAVFAVAFRTLRQAFSRRTGGMGFRA
jgi:hypothetical protein